MSRTIMTTSLHTLVQGQRVHYLANLGGLVVLAGLDKIAPDVLLGALLEMHSQLQKLTPDRKAALKDKGAQALQARHAEKRSFASWQRAVHRERFDFTRDEMKNLIKKLGGKVPVLEKDVVSELKRLLRLMPC